MSLEWWQAYPMASGKGDLTPSWKENRVIRFLYRWLPIFFCCHCRPERSFFFRGVQFPICARCTGVLFGMLIALFSLWAWVPTLWRMLLLMLPLVIDGTIQLKTRYESTNIRRLISGLLYGYALVGIIWLFVRSGFYNGMRIGAWLRRN